MLFRSAFDSASAELAKYKKTVESLLVTSAENKTQAYVSATSNLPMFNEHIENVQMHAIWMFFYHKN